MPLGRGGGVNSVGHFVLSPVLFTLRDHIYIYGKIGDCEQSRFSYV